MAGCRYRCRSVGDGDAIGNDGRRGHVGGGEHRAHPGHGEGAPGIDARQTGVGVPGAHHRRLEHAVGAHIGHEAAAPGEEGLGAEAGERRADHRARGVTAGRRSVTGGS